MIQPEPDGTPHPYAVDDDLGHLVWLASYPKSGNTWLRALLAAYASADPDNFSFGEMRLGANVLSRQWFTAQWGLPTTYLTATQIQRRLPPTLLAYDQHLTHVEFLKTHNAWRSPGEESSAFAGVYSRRAIVVVRNPLAVAPSLAHHMGCSIDEAIASMADSDYSLAAGRWHVAAQVPQYLGGWSTHVRGWLDQSDVAVTLIRYEDLRTDPHATLLRLLADCGLGVDAEHAARAVESTRFDRLQAQEAESGFREARRNRAFFRRGEADGWRDELTEAQIDTITRTHAEVMRRLGYLTGE
jgi:aryl sulfotransferase